MAVNVLRVERWMRLAAWGFVLSSTVCAAGFAYWFWDGMGGKIAGSGAVAAVFFLIIFKICGAVLEDEDAEN